MAPGPLSPPAMQKNLSVINHLLIYLIKQGPLPYRHLSFVELRMGGRGDSGLSVPSTSLGEGKNEEWEGRKRTGKMRHLGQDSH